MSRLVVALGLVIALTGLLLCGPLVWIFATHERGYARVLCIYREPQPAGTERLRVVWEAKVGDGQYVIGDAQRDSTFHPTGDPVLEPGDADRTAERFLPDAENRQIHPMVFWRANNPVASAFILDVNETHWWRRYVGGMATLFAGLMMTRIAWSYGRRR